MVFLSLRAAWLRRQRAKKQLTNAKKNLNKANNRYKLVKQQNNARAPPSRPGRNYGVMEMVRVKNAYGIHSVGIPNSQINNFKRRYRYVYGNNKTPGHYVLKE